MRTFDKQSARARYALLLRAAALASCRSDELYLKALPWRKEPLLRQAIRDAQDYAEGIFPRNGLKWSETLQIALWENEAELKSITFTGNAQRLSLVTKAAALRAEGARRARTARQQRAA